MDKKYNTAASGAMRESIGTKLDTALVPYELQIAAAVGLNYGAQKYNERNYEKGLSYRQLCASIERHNKAILDGEWLDANSQLPHFTLLASSIAMLCNNIMQGTVIDDRPEPKQGKGPDALAKEGQALLQPLVTAPAPMKVPYRQCKCELCGKEYMSNNFHYCEGPSQ